MGPCSSAGPSGDLKAATAPGRATYARRGGFSFQVSRPRLFTPAMPERPLEPWMTSSAGPFVTIKPGGPLHGVVTISVAPEGAERPLVVDATWKPLDSDPRSVSQPVDEYTAARRLAHQWADQLAAGREPTS